jgi:hypothetical protein
MVVANAESFLNPPSLGFFRMPRISEPLKAALVAAAEARALNQANGLVSAVRQNPEYDPYAERTGVFNGYVYQEGVAKWEIYPILLKKELPTPPEGRVWVEMNAPGTEHLWTLKKEAPPSGEQPSDGEQPPDGEQPDLDWVERAWGWAVPPPPGVVAVQVIVTERICDAVGNLVETVNLPNPGWSLRFKPGYAVCAEGSGGVPSPGGGADGGIPAPGGGADGWVPTPSGGADGVPAGGTSVAEKLSGVATVGAIGVIALAVAGVLVKK